MAKTDLTGKQFGCLTVVRDSGKRYRTHVLWECVDENGNTYLIKSCNLKRKNAYSKSREKQRRGNNVSNEYMIENGIVCVEMSNSNDVMLCDEQDWEFMKKFIWAKNQNGYAYSNTKEGKRLFHKMLLGGDDDNVIDHINGDKLDNRRQNLRLVSRSVNMFNRHKTASNKSGKVGVYKHGNKWCARICVNKNKIFLGNYSLLEDAIKARKEAELKYYGEYCSV